MKLEIHHYHHNYNEQQLCEIVAGIQTLLRKTIAMSAALDRLIKEVDDTKSAIDSIIEFNSGIANQLRALKDDPAKINALADELDAKQAEIATNILANTPAADEPE